MDRKKYNREYMRKRVKNFTPKQLDWERQRKREWHKIQKQKFPEKVKWLNRERYRKWREKLTPEQLQTHRDKVKRYKNQMTPEQKKKLNENSVKYTREVRRPRIRKLLLDIYGRCCACCGESEPVFLTVDHINGGGGLDLRKNGACTMYARIIKEKDKTKYQTLCYNCNCGRARNNGICPHKQLDILRWKKITPLKTIEVKQNGTDIIPGDTDWSVRPNV